MHSWFNSKEDSLPTPPPLFLSGHIIYLYDKGFLCGVYRSGQHKESRSPAADHPLHVPLHPGLHPRHSRHLLPTLQVVHQGYHTHTCWKPKTGSWFKEINELVYLLLTYVHCTLHSVDMRQQLSLHSRGLNYILLISPSSF